MLIRRDALRCALHAVTTDVSRYYLSALHLRPDGSVEATDGSILVRVADRYPQDPQDFPIVPGVGTPFDPPLPGTLIPSDVAKKLIAATPRKTPIPILQSIKVGSVEGHRYAVATDLSVPCVVNLDEASTQQFPTTDRVMIAEGSRPVITLTLSAAMLRKLADMADVIGRAKSENAVTLEIPTGAQYQGTREIKDPAGVPDALGNIPPIRVADGAICTAVRFTAAGADCRMEGVVMPCR